MIGGYKVIEIPVVSDERGNLSFVQLGQLLDFPIQRVYWLYNVTNTRGNHAHKKLKQLIFCASGSVDFVLDDGQSRETVTLNKPNMGLVISEPLWREIKNFSADASLIFLASDTLDEKDYIRSYDEFIQWKSHSSIKPNGLE